MVKKAQEPGAAANGAAATKPDEVTRLKRRLRQALQEVETLRVRNGVILDHLAHGLSLYDRNQKLVACNQQFLDIYRLPPSMGRKGVTFRAILEHRVKSNTHVGDDGDAYILDRLASVAEGVPIDGTSRLNTGQVIQMTHRPMADGGWISTHKDITELHEIQAELTHLAYHDPLTDLPNRALFYQRLGTAFGDGAPFAVLCLDLDGFKQVNDTLGHAMGDALLKQVTERLLKLIGPEDLAARMGGDEFAILQMGGDIRAAVTLADAIRLAMEKPFEFAGDVVSIAAGIGIAAAPDDGRSIDELLHAADLALYAAKRDKKGSIRVFERSLDAAASGRRQLEDSLKWALELGQFRLAFQPIINLEKRRFAGFEALLRWDHPEMGAIPPGVFIPVAEETGLIVPIGEWVLREALSEAASWPDDLKIAVNVSSLQLRRGNLVSTVINALAGSGIAHGRVELEITESVFLEQSVQNLEALRKLHDLGVRIALDDFGTGFSALSYLLAFPFDKIKIDGGFVRALDDSPGARTIVSAVADIGHRLGMLTTAEGIESAEQLRNVHAVGYSEAQGYLIARPMTREAVRRLLQGAYDVMPREPLDLRVAG